MVVGLLPPTSGEVDHRRRVDERRQTIAGAPAVAPPHPDDLPGSLCQPQSALPGRRHRRRTDPRLRPDRGRAQHPGAGRRAVDPGRPARRRRLEISARIFRRAAAADRDRARAGVGSRIHRLRRADLGARCLRAGADPQSDARPAGQVRPHLSLHQPQPRRGPAHGEPHRRDVSRPHRRDRRGARTLQQPANALHQDAAGRGSRSRDVRPPADSGAGRNPQPDRSAARLRLQPALSAGVRPLPQGSARADRRRRLPRRQRSGAPRPRPDHRDGAAMRASEPVGSPPRLWSSARAEYQHNDGFP